VKLTLGYYFGLSAATGSLMDAHDVFQFSMNSYGPENYHGRSSRYQVPPPTEPPQPQVTQTPTPDPTPPITEAPKVPTSFNFNPPNFQQQFPFPNVQQFPPQTQPPQTQPPINQPIQYPPVQNQQLNDQIQIQLQSVTQLQSQLQLQLADITEKLNILSTRIDNQEKFAIDTRNFMVNALNSLIQSQVTRQDLEQLSRSVGSGGNNDNQVITGLDGLRQTIAELSDQVRSKLNIVSDLHRSTNENSQTIKTVKSQVDIFTSDVRNALNQVKEASKELGSSIINNTSFGFWTYFIFFQFIFFIGFAYWRSRNSHRSHLL